MTDRPVAFLFYSTSLMNWFKSNKEFFLLFPHVYCLFCCLLPSKLFLLYIIIILFFVVHRNIQWNSLFNLFTSNAFWIEYNGLTMKFTFFFVIVCCVCTVHMHLWKKRKTKWFEVKSSSRDSFRETKAIYCLTNNARIKSIKILLLHYGIVIIQLQNTIAHHLQITIIWNENPLK